MIPRTQTQISFQSFQCHRQMSFVGRSEAANGDNRPYPIQSNAIRMQLLLLDYKQFKAARIIQKTFRGYYVRNMIKKRNAAAVVIQRYWRKYKSKRQLVVIAQELTQASLLLKFNLSSLKIQAFFRGWWSRKYVNNMLFLKEKRLQCLEDILITFASKLHTFMRTGHLPGYKEFCRDNRIVLNELLSTLNYRFFNRYVGIKYVKTKCVMAEHYRTFQASFDYTSAPYAGFNQYMRCRRAKSLDNEPKAYGMHDHDIIQAFVRANRVTSAYKYPKKPDDDRTNARQIQYESERHFCKDLAKSMRFWPGCNECRETKITDSFIANNMDSFFSYIKFQLEDMKYILNCNCERDKNKNIPLQECT